jgi:hypothetical protein
MLINLLSDLAGFNNGCGIKMNTLSIAVLLIGSKSYSQSTKGSSMKNLLKL